MPGAFSFAPTVPLGAGPRARRWGSLCPMQAAIQSFRCFAVGTPRRRQAGRAGLFSPVRPAIFLNRSIVSQAACRGKQLSLGMAAALLVPSIALAGESGPAAGDVASALLGSWLVQLGFVLGLLVASLKVYDHFRPKPPLHQQYAPIKHEHPELHSSADATACRKHQTRELMTIRQEMGGFTGKVERQIDHLRDAMTTQNAQMIAAIKDLDEKQEQRIRRIHDRIDPIVERVAANKQAIEQHLADARSKGE